MRVVVGILFFSLCAHAIEPTPQEDYRRYIESLKRLHEEWESKQTIDMKNPPFAWDTGSNRRMYGSPYQYLLELHLSNPSARRGADFSGILPSSSGGLCSVYSKGGNSDGFCGRSAPPFGSLTGAEAFDSSLWLGARRYISDTSRLPGQFGDKRGAREKARLDDILHANREMSDHLEIRRTEFRATVQDFTEKSLDRVSNEMTREYLPRFQNLVKDTVPAVLAKSPEKAEKIDMRFLENLRDQDDPPHVRTIRTTVQQASGPQRWQQLEPVWRLALARADQMPVSSQRAMERIYSDYFDDNGLVNFHVVSPNTAAFARHVGDSLQTSPHTPQGREIRYQLNRGFVAASESSTPGKKAEAWGAISLIVGADQAYADGASKDARYLLRLGASILDVALGFVPVVGTANDLAQLVHGMATGYDYTGERMTSADYALRGVGLVAGIVGAGSIVKIAGKALQKAFQQGSRIIRRLGVGEKASKVASSSKVTHLAPDIAEIIGHFGEEKASAVLELFSKGSETLQKEGLEKLSRILRDSSIPSEQRLGIVRAFKNGTVVPSTAVGKFANAELREGHFLKHGKDFGAKTAQEYEKRAATFMLGDLSPGVLEKTNSYGDIIRYNVLTDEFGMFSKQGFIRTYYKPDLQIHKLPTHLDYFYAQ